MGRTGAWSGSVIGSSLPGGNRSGLAGVQSAPDEGGGAMGARWGWALIGGVVAGALAVGIVAMVDDGASPVAAQTTTPTTGGEASAAPRTVTVSADGTASGTPDTAIVQLGVQTQAAKANDDLDMAEGDAQELLDALRDSGLEKMA